MTTPTPEDDVKQLRDALARPAQFDFALDFLGGPEVGELLAYVVALEARIEAQAVRLEAAERDAKFWDYLRRHWWNCRFSWNKTDASLKSLTLTIRADHISTSASEIEREVLAAIASEAKP